MTKQATCGEAIIGLLEQYDVTTIFGIPGVHNLELYRGLENSNIEHILVRHEQGAGFMADGYARISGKAGVCFVISGPGVTNIATPIGQAFSDSIPMLVISSDAPSESLGKGEGYLHEVTDLASVTDSLTAFSANIKSVDEVPEAIAKAFKLFNSERPRPVHLSIPLDVLAQPISEAWTKESDLGTKPTAAAQDIKAASQLLATAKQPVILVGAGLKKDTQSSEAIQTIAEHCSASVITSNAAKGIIDEVHPLALASRYGNKAVQDYISKADVILAVATEFGEADSWAGDFNFSGKLIRIDIDPSKVNDRFTAEVAILADAQASVLSIADALTKLPPSEESNVQLVQELKKSILSELSPLEKQHQKVLETLATVVKNSANNNAFVTGDMTQIVYSGVSLYPARQPNSWFYPSGYGTLGFALPNAIGSKFAAPERDAVVLVGDGGFQYTLQELGTAVENKLPMAIILWNNDGLGEIENSMRQVNIRPVQVKPHNPDFIALAKAYGCDAVSIGSQEEFEKEVLGSFAKDKPTLIEVREGSSWLLS